MIFIVCLFAVSAVSATDNATSDVLGIEETTNEVVGIEKNNSVIGLSGGEIDILSANSDASFTDLANDIANANGEFKLSKNYVYDSTKDSNYKNGIVIDKEITINGRGFIINGDNQARAFYVNASNVILRNMEFINCSSSGSGGAVYWNGDDGSLFDCNFINCYNSGYDNFTSGYQSLSVYGRGYGGAVYWAGNNGIIYGCNFNNCYINNIQSNQYAKSIIHFTVSTFSYSYGGAVYWKGNEGSLFGCNFTSTSYSSSGSSSSSSKKGGAIYWQRTDGNLINSSFINCHVPNNGLASAVYWYGNDGFLY